jgi:hypothetical protein
MFCKIKLHWQTAIRESASDPSSVSTCLGSLGYAIRNRIVEKDTRQPLSLQVAFFQWHCDSLNAALSSKVSIRSIFSFNVSLNEDSGISFIETSPNIRNDYLINGTTILQCFYKKNRH